MIRNTNSSAGVNMLESASRLCWTARNTRVFDVLKTSECRLRAHVIKDRGTRLQTLMSPLQDASRSS